MNKPIRTKGIDTPMVVIGADGDEMVGTREEVAATAHAYGTTPIQLRGAHDMMLDTYWEQVASAIESSIAQHVPSLATAT